MGRDREAALISALLDDARVGGSSLLVLGAPGAGVTAMLQLAAEAARRRGFGVLRAAARPAEAAVPFAGLRRIVWRARQAAGMQTADLPVLDPMRAEQSGVVLAEELNVLLDRLTGPGPVLVNVDDAHWLDGPSLDALDALARRPGPAPVALVLGARAGRLVLEGATELVLGPLDDDACVAIVERSGAEVGRAVRDRILADAAGRPLALHELPLAWRAVPEIGADLWERFSPLTDTLSRVYRRELRRVPAATATALLVAALHLGDDVEEIVGAAGLVVGEDLTAEALSPAVEEGFLALTQGTVRFGDPLLRAAVVHAATPAAQRDAYAALAIVHEREPHRGAWFTAHTLTGPDETAAAALEISAADATRSGDAVDGLRRLEWAARLSPHPSRRADRLIRAAACAFDIGRPQVGEHLLQKAELLGTTVAQRALADTMRARFTTPITWQGVTISDRCRLVSTLARNGRVDDALDVLVGITQSLAWAGPDPASRTQVLECLDDLGGAAGDPRYVAALAMAAPERAQRLTAALVPDPRDTTACRLVAVAAVATGDIARAADLLAAAAAQLRSSGRKGLLTQVQGLHAHVTIALGDWNVSAAAATESLSLARATDQRLWELRALASRSVVRALRGELDPARADADTVERALAGRPLGSMLASVQLARALALVHDERWEDAYDTLRRLFDPSDPVFNQGATFRVLGYLAEIGARCGRVEETRAIADGLAAVGAEGNPVLAVNLGFARAVLSDDEHAEALFARARAQTPAVWPWMRARIDLAHGTWLRRHRRPAESRALLQAARHTLDLMGAVAWSAHARRELRAAGVDVGTTAGGVKGVHGAHGVLGVLSPQEEQIARLAAEGLSNREIGQRLFLSPRTVGSHLYRIFPKLDVTSRAQLASRLAAASEAG